MQKSAFFVLTCNTLLDLTVTSIKIEGAAFNFVKCVGLLVFPRNAPQLILI